MTSAALYEYSQGDVRIIVSLLYSGQLLTKQISAYRDNL